MAALERSPAAHDVDLRIELASARRHVAFLEKAGVRLTRSLDEEQLLDDLVSLVMEGPDRLADWVAILRPDGRGGLAPVRSSHFDPERESLARQVQRTGPVSLSGGAPAAEVYWSGDAVLTPALGEGHMLDAPPELAELIAQLDCGPGALLAIAARGRTLGVLSAVRRAGRPPFDETELAALRDLCRFAGLALINARLFDQQARIVTVLQKALLPPDLPPISGTTLAARYRPADDAVDVGGDFYDVFPLAQNRWLLVTGDVAGRGVEAAGATGLARQTLRALGADHSPAAALGRLNELLLAQAGFGATERFLTVVAAELNRTPSGTFRLRIASGGHPPPLLIRSSCVHLLGEPGMLLGAVDEVEFRETDHVLEPGDTLIFYTDGVLEARGKDGLFGEERLASAARECWERTGDPEVLLDCLLDAVDDFRSEPDVDDTALLALTIAD